MELRRVKGTEDFYPEEQAIRKAIYSKLAEQAKKFGFQEVDAPILELLFLLGVLLLFSLILFSCYFFPLERS